MKNGERIILASGSPRRKELLGMIYSEFEVIVADCEEKAESQVPEKIVLELSRQKASVVALDDKIEGKALIIGADTIVSVDGEILGKPTDKDDARWMIGMLSGKTHQVCTGVTLIQTDRKGRLYRQKSFVETTSVRVAELDEEEIEAYIQTEESYDKAGGYGIQGLFGKHVEGIGGDYNNVVGLPVHRLYVELRQWL
ncbi:MAG: Maf family protein [Roseburia sp.]|nr:Maf family protein [Roseburia sp.]